MPTAPPHPLRCRCGTVQGELLYPHRALRAVCYCRDCQTYAHALGEAARILDASGGTEVVATRADHLRLHAGTERLACLRLTDQGILRWYAGCCHTPLANTLRQMRLPYVSVPHVALDRGHRAESFGPVRMRVHARHARGRPPVAALQWLQLLRIAPGLVWATLSGRWRATPFFDATTGRPVAQPRVLGADEYRRARRALPGGGR